MEENGGEVWILELYSDRSLKNTLITSCLEKLLIVSSIESENAVIAKLNNMGIRNGEKAGWDAHTLNKEMIEMLKPDCEDTAKKIETNAYYRWKEEHKQELDWYCESLTELKSNGILQMFFLFVKKFQGTRKITSSPVLECLFPDSPTRFILRTVGDDL